MTTGDRKPHWLSWRAEVPPVPWKERFGRDAPLHLEVGFGDGRFTVRRAVEHPDDNFVGVELSGVSVRRALGNLRRSAVTNVRVMKAPAEVVVRRCFGPSTLSSITVNFPDPWPKERHEDHRLLKRSFYRLASTRLVDGGEIRLATDHAPYRDFAVAEAVASACFDVVDADPPAATFETKYALKWKGQGKPLHYVVFRRTRVDDDPHAVPERPHVMPHALFEGAVPRPSTFQKLITRVDGGHVIVHEVATAVGGDRGDERLLFRVTVDEDDLVQQLLVVVQRRERDVIVRLESFGDPIVTQAVRGAVATVTTWVEEQGTARVLERNY